MPIVGVRRAFDRQPPSPVLVGIPGALKPRYGWCGSAPNRELVTGYPTQFAGSAAMQVGRDGREVLTPSGWSSYIYLRNAINVPGPFTVVFRYRFDTVPTSWERIVGLHAYSSDAGTFHLVMLSDGSNKLRFQYNDAAGANQPYADTPTGMTAGDWVTVVGTVSPTTIEILHSKAGYASASASGSYPGAYWDPGQHMAICGNGQGGGVPYMAASMFALLDGYAPPALQRSLVANPWQVFG